MSTKPMTPFAANPWVFVFSVVLIVAAVGYYAWGAVDHLALPQDERVAVVTGKQFNPPGVSYRTNIVQGRAWTQADPVAETHVLSVEIDREASVVIVDKPLFDAAQSGDRLRVKAQRTRLTRRLEVTEVLGPLTP
jgi:hypothetical protein